MSKAVCTIVSKNYLAYALTLRESVLRIHSNVSFYILIVDTKSPDPQLLDEGIVWVEDIGIEDFYSYAMRFDIMELNTNVKPHFLEWLLNRHEKVIYLDPDIEVYSELDLIFENLDQFSVVVTPHITKPIDDNMKPTEIDFLRDGTFNLGFIAVRDSVNARSMLAWWSRRCLEHGYNDTHLGLFTDQKWTNLIPCLFPDFISLRDPGLNVSYWNLHERQVSCVDGVYLVNGVARLIFYHFSGFDINNISMISRHQNRSSLTFRHDIKILFEKYRDNLLKNRHEEFVRIPYGFRCFEDGRAISIVARRLFEMFPNEGTENPFRVGSKFHMFCLRKHLMSTGAPSKRYNSYNTPQSDPRLRFVRSLFRVIHSIIGPDRYFLLMRYLGYLSSMRNQREIFFPDAR